jgi:hypothetical protein
MAGVGAGYTGCLGALVGAGFIPARKLQQKPTEKREGINPSPTLIYD